MRSEGFSAEATNAANENTNPGLPTSTVIVKIRFNPYMKWWQANLHERLHDGSIRPFRASTANLIAAKSYAECASQTEGLLNSLQVKWRIEDVGASIIGT